MTYQNKISTCKLVLLLLLFLVTLRPPADLDLGWHLRYGEYFFQTGHVLKDNIISFVWPTYKWVEASWGYDLILYQIFTHFSFLGIAVSGYIISLLTFIFLVQPMNLPRPYGRGIFSPKGMKKISAEFKISHTVNHVWEKIRKHHA